MDKPYSTIQTEYVWTDSRAAANMGLAKTGGQWLIEVLCFYFTLVLGDSLVLLYARLR